MVNAGDGQLACTPVQQLVECAVLVGKAQAMRFDANDKTMLVNRLADGKIIAQRACPTIFDLTGSKQLPPQSHSSPPGKVAVGIPHQGGTTGIPNRSKQRGKMSTLGQIPAETGADSHLLILERIDQMAQPEFGRTDVGVTKGQYSVLGPEVSDGVQQIVNLLSSLLGLACKQNPALPVRILHLHLTQNAGTAVLLLPCDQQNLKIGIILLEIGPQVGFQARIDSSAGNNQSGGRSKISGRPVQPPAQEPGVLDSASDRVNALYESKKSKAEKKSGENREPPVAI